MTILKFLHPLVFFYAVEMLHKKFMAFDLGEWSTGICVGDSSTRKIYPIKGDDWDGYVLSPLEQILNQIYDGSGQYVAGWFIPDSLFSPQVLYPTKMAVSQMREVLNQLASKHNVEYYIFSFNANTRIWDCKEKHAFIRKQLKDLEEDGRLTTKWFTFVDKFHSTKCADDFLRKEFSQLYDPRLFLDTHTLVRDQIHAHPRYQDPGDQNFISDLADVRKRILDSYSACNFTWKFFTSCRRKALMAGDGIAKVQMMLEYANFIGYPRSPSPIPPSKVEEAAEFLRELEEESEEERIF